MSHQGPIIRKWFQPGEGIAREVITADIQRYLGPDALVRPGIGEGDMKDVRGYWITAYRGLTSNMVESLRKDTERWRMEVDNQQADTRERIADDADQLLRRYVDSDIHINRQHHGPPPGGHPIHYHPAPPEMGNPIHSDRQPEYRHPNPRFEPSPNYPGPGSHGTPPPQGYPYPGGHSSVNSGYGHPNMGNPQPPRGPPQPSYSYPEPVEYYQPQTVGHGDPRGDLRGDPRADPRGDPRGDLRGVQRNGGPHHHYPTNQPMREAVYTQGSSNPPPFYDNGRPYQQPPQPNIARRRP